MFSMNKSRGWHKGSAMKKIGVGMLVVGVATAAVYGVRAYLRRRGNHNTEEKVEIEE